MSADVPSTEAAGAAGATEAAGAASTFAARPFVIEPPGDVATVTACALVAAEHWGLPTPTLLRLGMNGIFAAGNVMLRVSRPTAPGENAMRLAELLTDHGVRVPQYVRDDAFSVDGHVVFAIESIATVGAVDWVAVGEMIRRLHQFEPASISAVFPTPWCGSFPWWEFAATFDAVRPLLDATSARALADSIARNLPVLHAARSDRLVVCHGDVHPGNVVQGVHGPVLLDWDLVCLGPAGWDHAPLMTWTSRWGGEPGLYESFAAGYGRSLRGDTTAAAIAELRLVAATLMRLKAAQRNPAALPEALRRLQWWRGESDAPMWQAQ